MEVCLLQSVATVPGYILNSLAFVCVSAGIWSWLFSSSLHQQISYSDLVVCWKLEYSALQCGKGFFFRMLLEPIQSKVMREIRVLRL